MEYNKRLASLKKLIDNIDLDALLVTAGSNIFYLTGFRGTDAQLLVTQRSNYFITDSRFEEEAKRSVKGCKIVIPEKSYYSTIKDLCEDHGYKKIGFESASISFASADRLKRISKRSSFVPTAELVESLRALKDVDEIAAIRASIAITKAIFERRMRNIKPGISEREISMLIEKDFLEKYAEKSFDPIVACGANSSMPHAIPSNKRFTNNSFVMVDVGCAYNG